MKVTILTTALAVAVTCGMVSPALAQPGQSNHHVRGNKGYVELDQRGWRNGTAGSSSQPMHRRPPASPLPDSNRGGHRSGGTYRSQVEKYGNQSNSGSTSDQRGARYGQSRSGTRVQTQVQGGGSGQRVAGSSNRGGVQFRQPGNGPAGSNAMTAKEKQRQIEAANRAEKQKLRNIKDKSRTATRGVGKPYPEGSRYGQLTQKFKREATSRATANPQRPQIDMDERGSKYSNKPSSRKTVVDVKKPGDVKQARNAGKATTTGRSAKAAQQTANAARTANAASTAKAAKNAKNVASAAKVAGNVAKGTGVALVGAAVLKDTTGIDPIELGITAVDDAINGTNNAEQSLNNVENSFNRSLTKQVFTNPEAAAKRVKNDLDTAGRDISKAVKDPGKAINSLFTP